MAIICNIKSALMNIGTPEVRENISSFSSPVNQINQISLQMFPLQLKTNSPGIHPVNYICQWVLALVQSLWIQGILSILWLISLIPTNCPYRAHKDDRQDDVEVMSTDSSSSSSSDSQWILVQLSNLNKRFRRHFSTILIFNLLTYYTTDRPTAVFPEGLCLHFNMFRML